MYLHGKAQQCTSRLAYVRATVLYHNDGLCQLYAASIVLYHNIVWRASGTCIALLLHKIHGTIVYQ